MKEKYINYKDLFTFFCNRTRNEAEYPKIKFNDEDKKYNCERKSHHGNYRFIQFSPDTDYLVPRNPVGK
jgi:hypothetical protein